jgi:hypothetical protein
MSRARAVLAAIGVDVAVCYGAFAVLGLFVNLLSTGGIVDTRVTLADLLSGDLTQAALGGGSGLGVFLILFATASIAVPYFWKHRLAPLAFGVPLFVTLLGFWPLYVQHRRQQEAVRAMGELGQVLGELAEQMSAQIGGPLANLGTAAWLLIATVLFLAFRGVVRALASR